MGHAGGNRHPCGGTSGDVQGNGAAGELILIISPAAGVLMVETALGDAGLPVKTLNRMTGLTVASFRIGAAWHDTWFFLRMCRDQVGGSVLRSTPLRNSRRRKSGRMIVNRFDPVRAVKGLWGADYLLSLSLLSLSCSVR